ncbi:alpha/beta hydrolase [Salinisphaera sp. T31B1]|uniref:alpha/beta fold hydrolase n=1 Tax=Salinisphaera sp. T31B1 TaxID=727963 RepID=UPI00334263C5
MSVKVDSTRAEYVDIEGERLHVVVTPGAGVPLLVCNEFVANLEILDDFAGALDRPVIRFDLPGVGRSSDVRAMRRMGGLARVLAGLLDGLGIDRPVDIMGIGWGGLLAQQFARDHAERTRRLVLAATSSGQLMLPGRLASLVRLARPAGLARAAPDAAQARRLFGGRRNDECDAIAVALARARTPTRRGHAGQLYALAGYTSLGWLHRLNVPTLVMAGDDDAIVPVVNSRVLALLLPLARLAVVRGGGHWFVLERTDEVVRLISEFLDSRVAITERDQNNTL